MKNFHHMFDAPLCMLLGNSDENFIPAFGIGNVDVLVKWLVKLNAVCMPLRYLCVFVAWCFFFTTFACVGGIYSEDPFQLTLNLITPLVLLGLGMIMPKLAKKSK